jgi:mono/diheme cytochrome c family protein
MPVRKRAARTDIVILVALGLVATVLAVGCGSSTTTTQAPATNATTSSSGTTGTTGATAGGTTTTAGATTTSGASVDGKALFTQYCGSCHKNGLGNVSAADQSRVESVIMNGKDSMPGFSSQLSAEQITAIYNYMATGN